MAGTILRAVLEREAERQLRGVGDPRLGEWREMGDQAFHVRRRLTPAEDRGWGVGPVADVRGTPEAAARVRALGGWASFLPEDLLREETGLGGWPRRPT